jgi:KGK domain
MANKFEVNTNEYLNQCDEKDVISFDSEKLISVSKLKDIVFQSFSESGIAAIINYLAQKLDVSVRNINSWFDQGVKCEILRAGSQGWQKGKIKINVTLEFIPDEPEEAEIEPIQQHANSLDDIRQIISQ